MKFSHPKLYIDTSAFYALIDRSDKYHAMAKVLWPSLLTNNIEMLTSNYIVAETIELMQSRLGFKAANMWRQAVLGVVDVKWVNESIHCQGLNLWMSLGRKGCGFIDCISFIVMNHHQVEQVFGFKESYDEQGYDVIPKIEVFNQNCATR